MATTPLGFHYPANSDAPGGPSQIQQLATDLDTYLTPASVRMVGIASQTVSATTNIILAIAEDDFGGWNSSTHLWTVPIAGRYQVSAQTRCGLTAALVTCQLIVNGTSVMTTSASTSVAGANAGLSIARRFALGDTVAIQSGVSYTMSTTGQVDNWLSLIRIAP